MRYVNLILLIIITLQWDPCSEKFIKIYARASTDIKFRNITTVSGRVNTAKVSVDGRRNWYFYATSHNGILESAPSNIVYSPRGW